MESTELKKKNVFESMSSPKKFMLLSVFTLILSATFYGLLEVVFVGFRYFEIVRAYDEGNDYNYRFLPSDRFAWTYRPELRDYSYEKSAYSLKANISTDSYGFRNRGRSYEEAEVAFVGDSFISPVWIDDQKSVTGQFEAITGIKGINVAVTGWSLSQYLEAVTFLNERSKKLKNIFVFIYENDFMDYDTQHLDKEWALNHFAPTPAPTLRSQWKELTLFSMLTKIGALQPPSDFCVTSRGKYYLNKRRFLDVQVMSTKSMMAKVHRANSSSARLSFILLPSQARVHAAEILAVCPGMGKEFSANEIAAYADIKDAFRRVDLNIIDFAEILQKDLAEKSRSAFIEMDGHLNEYGHGLLARVLRDQVESSFLIETHPLYSKFRQQTP